MDPLAHRILAAIKQHGTFTPAERAALDAALAGSSSTQTRAWQAWPDAQTFLGDLSEWAANLPPEDIPPRLKKAAFDFGWSERTILRWLNRAGLERWEDFERFYALARRPLIGLDDVTC